MIVGRIVLAESILFAIPAYIFKAQGVPKVPLDGVNRVTRSLFSGREPHYT